MSSMLSDSATAATRSSWACRTECLPLPPSWGGPSGAVHPAPATRVPEHACSALTRVWRSAPSGCASLPAITGSCTSALTGKPVLTGGCRSARCVSSTTAARAGVGPADGRQRGAWGGATCSALHAAHVIAHKHTAAVRCAGACCAWCPRGLAVERSAPRTQTHSCGRLDTCFRSHQHSIARTSGRLDTGFRSHQHSIAREHVACDQTLSCHKPHASHDCRTLLAGVTGISRRARPAWVCVPCMLPYPLHPCP
jgi:hypothetical protein